MKTMNMMAVLALVAAAHSISTRTASARDVTAQTQTIRTFDLPAVRVYASPEQEAQAVVAQAIRVHDLPAVRVHAVRETADTRTATMASMRTKLRRESLAIPRGTLRRGLALERPVQTRTDDRNDRWVALGCMIRLRLSRVWPMQGCNAGRSTSGLLRPRTEAAMAQASLGRRR